ncbi:hypothetical protein KKG72_02235 [bacterium]|nr:hypothetical protein [bacterium]MBU1995020.1 hypothetical protein [bacterium]
MIVGNYKVIVKKYFNEAGKRIIFLSGLACGSGVWSIFSRNSGKENKA